MRQPDDLGILGELGVGLDLCFAHPHQTPLRVVAQRRIRSEWRGAPAGVGLGQVPGAARAYIELIHTSEKGQSDNERPSDKKVLRSLLITEVAMGGAHQSGVRTVLAWHDAQCSV